MKALHLKLGQGARESRGNAECGLNTGKPEIMPTDLIRAIISGLPTTCAPVNNQVSKKSSGAR